MKRTREKISFDDRIAICCFFTAVRQRVGAEQKARLLFADLAAYTGADREQRLLAGAKTEGKVVWYTSLAGSSYKELAKGFEVEISRHQDRTLSRHQLGHHDEDQRRGAGKANHRRCDRNYAADLAVLAREQTAHRFHFASSRQISPGHEGKRRARACLLGDRPRDLHGRWL